MFGLAKKSAFPLYLGIIVAILGILNLLVRVRRVRRALALPFSAALRDKGSIGFALLSCDTLVMNNTHSFFKRRKLFTKKKVIFQILKKGRQLTK